MYKFKLCNINFPHILEEESIERENNENDVTDEINLNESINTEFGISNLNLDKYDNMAFNPLRFENINNRQDKQDDIVNVEHIPTCTYLTTDEFHQNLNRNNNNFTILSANIRSISKNFEKLKECLKAIENEFTIIGLSETHLKDVPTAYHKLPGYNIEYTNRHNKQKGGVCLYISNNVKYKKGQICQ